MNTDKKDVICSFDRVFMRDDPFSYSFSVYSNSVHGLFTDKPQVAICILRCLAGIDQPLKGEISFDGKKYRSLKPKQAVRLGIEIVDHSSKSFLDLSVLDNIYCERKQFNSTHIRSRNLARQRFLELTRQVGVLIDLKAPARTLTAAERKLIELFRSIIASPRILCLEEGILRDIEEHTVPGIRDKLRLILLRMVKNGLTLIIASNDMNEISKYSNQISIFKQNGEAETVTVAQVEKYYLMQMAYGFITSRTELAQDNFELFYFKQLYQEIINSLIFPVIATDTHHNIIIYNQEVKRVYFNDYEELVGTKIQKVLGLPDDIIKDIEKELLFMPKTRVHLLRDLLEDTRIYVSPITDNMGSFMGMMYVFSKEEKDGAMFGSYLNKPVDIEYEYKISELIHEVRNPLSIMLNYLSLIQKENSIETIKEETKFISREVSRINRLLESLKKERGESTSPKKKKVMLSSLIDEIYEFLAPMMEDKHIKFSDDVGDICCLGVDEDSLRQVFINIILNAIEAMTMVDGIIMVTGTQIQRDNQPFVEIKVTDNAGGILPEHLPNIFNPFFTTKSDQNSHGIGLSITREIIESIEGTIEVESEVGLGTTFTIVLRQS